MQKYKSTELLDQLQADVRKLILSATYFKTIDPATLLQQPVPGKWSVIEVLEHLNSYSRFYLLAIEKGLRENKPALDTFKPGWIGDYFTKLMKPRENGTVANKMKAPKGHRPPKFLDAFPVLNGFIEQQHYLLELLEQAKSKNIGNIRIPITISKFIRLKLGDTFRFLIAHEQRHFVQIENVLQQLNAISPGKYPKVLQAM